MTRCEDGNGTTKCGDHEICADCVLYNLLGQHAEDAFARQLLARLTHSKSALKTGEVLKREEEPFKGLFMLTTGALKTYTISEDGNEQIISFHLPGELIGLSAMGRGYHVGCTVAISPSNLCAMPAQDLEKLCAREPKLQRRLFGLATQELSRRERLHQLMSGSRAEGRLAMALLNIACRLQSHDGSSLHRFRLPMARADLAAYLGLTPETTSRHLRSWESKGMIATRGREFEIRKPNELERMAGQEHVDGQDQDKNRFNLRVV